MTPQELCDKHEIAELIYRYATSVDTKDWERMASVFTEDAYLDYSSVGYPPGSRDDVLALLQKALDQLPMTQHFVTNIEVDLDGDEVVVTLGSPTVVPGVHLAADVRVTVFEEPS